MLSGNGLMYRKNRKKYYDDTIPQRNLENHKKL